MTRRIVLGGLIAILGGLAGCGATGATAEPTDPADPPPADGDPVAPPVPVGLRSRTLVTQPPEMNEPPAVPPGTMDPQAARVQGDGAVPEPRAVPGGSAAGGDGLDHDAVREVVRAQQSRFRYCFDRLRRDNPRVAEARVTVHITIDRGGTVDGAEVTSGSPEDSGFESCLVARVKALRFPEADGPTELNYPFSFQVTESGN